MKINKKHFPSQRISSLPHIPNENPLQYQSDIDQYLKKYSPISQLKLTDPSKLKHSLLNDNHFLLIIKHLLIKQKKTSQELDLIKLYLSQLDKFTSILSSLNSNLDQLLSRLCFHIKIEHSTSNGIVYKQGDKCDKLYLIIKGSVCILNTFVSNAKITPVNYIKYLILLRFYEEKDVLSKTIHSNTNTYPINETSINNLYTIFKLYKLFKDNQSLFHSPPYNTYTSISQFLSSEKTIVSFITSKLSLPSNVLHFLSPLNIPSCDIQSIFDFYESIYDSHISSKKRYIPSSRMQSLHITHSHPSTDIILDSIYSDLISEKDPSLYYTSVHEYCIRIHYNSFTSDDGNNVVVYEYREVCKYGKGDIFGENALMKTERKTSETVITDEECFFGNVSKSEFDICLKYTQDKIRSMNSKFFLKGAIFKNVNQNMFEMRIYNMFKEISYKRGDIIIERNSSKREIHFIYEGEVDIIVECSLGHLYNIVNSLCMENPLEGKVKQMGNAYEEFKDFFENKKFTFAIAKFKQSEITGLDNLTLGNGVYLFDCICSSKYVKAFCLNDKGYKYITHDATVKANIDEYVYIKRQILCEHICEIIESHISTYDNKYSSNALYTKGKKYNVVLFNSSIQKKIKLKGNIDKGYEIPPIEKSCDFPTLQNVNSYRPFYKKFKSTNPLKINSCLSDSNVPIKSISSYNKYNNYDIISMSNTNNSNTLSNFNGNIFSHSSSNDCFDMCGNVSAYQSIETNPPIKNAKSSYKNYFSNVPSQRNHTSSNFGLIGSGKHLNDVHAHVALTLSDLNANMPFDVHSFRKTLRTKKVMIVKSRNGNKRLKEKKIRFYDNKTIWNNDVFMKTNHTLFNNVLLPYENTNTNKIPEIVKKTQKRNHGVIDCLCLDKWIEKHFENPLDYNYYNL